MATRHHKSSLTHVSIDQLRTELSRRQRMAAPLVRQRKALAARLATLDAQLQSYGLGSAPTANGQADAPRTRANNKTSLLDALRSVLKGKTMSVAEAADAVRKAGYASASKHFRTMVNIALIKKKHFKRVARGHYTAG